MNATKPLTTHDDVTIANGASLSAATVLGGFHLVGVLMPAAWTAASITLQASLDGVTFYDVYDRYGVEYTVAAAASRYVALPPIDLGTVEQIKIRSGTGAAVVNQGAARVLTLVLKPYA